MNAIETNRSAQREINVPVEEIYTLLTTPDQHHRFDSTSMVGESVTAGRLSRVGDIFTMEMTYRGGDEPMRYRTDNHVTTLDEPRCVEWAVASPGQAPFGWRWRYDLERSGSTTTRVTLTYDWAGTPEETMIRFGVPLVTEDQLADSLSMLAKATENA